MQVVDGRAYWQNVRDEMRNLAVLRGRAEELAASADGVRGIRTDRVGGGQAARDAIGALLAKRDETGARLADAIAQSAALVSQARGILESMRRTGCACRGDDIDVLERWAIDGDSLREIGEELGVSKVTAVNRKRRAVEASEPFMPMVSE